MPIPILTSLRHRAFLPVLILRALILLGAATVSAGPSAAAPAPRGVQVVVRTLRWPGEHIEADCPGIVRPRGAGARAFNRAAAAWVRGRVTAFRRDRAGSRGTDEEIRCRVRLATPCLVSVEFEEGNYFGGPYSNIYYSGLTFDLRRGRPLPRRALFRPGVNGRQALLAFCRRTRATGAAGEPSAGDWAGWAVGRRGVFVYLDLPHVVAAADRVFVPYSALPDLFENSTTR